MDFLRLYTYFRITADSSLAMIRNKSRFVFSQAIEFCMKRWKLMNETKEGMEGNKNENKMSTESPVFTLGRSGALIKLFTWLS